ncbi:MAG: CoB--CoM heterodisulfide reductase iron-sulfur subunit B family protein [Desulfobacteraceae bacterium]|nr:CoB--CoM heterodisulfide reductase iron-sulfur subunit B family protein [Desulfobacteraceae bacterium]
MKKRYALFLGCSIPVRLPQYERSARAVLGRLGVQLVDIPEFNCCGYPLRNFDQKAFVLSSARNIALAEREGLDLLALCQCGFGTMRMADFHLKEDDRLRTAIGKVLAKEGLRYTGNAQVKHLLSVLFHEVGLETIKSHISQPYDSLKVGTHYGCHALRPSHIMKFDNPVAPTLFDRLVETTGAESLAWPMKLDCCGGPLKGTDDTLSLDFAEKKLEDAGRAGAHCITTACPYCQIQFDIAPKRMMFERGGNHQVPAILFTQLLGLAMGIDRQTLGVHLNKGDMAYIESSHGVMV